MTIRFDVCLVIAAFAFAWFGHVYTAVACIGILWLHKYG